MVAPRAAEGWNPGESEAHRSARVHGTDGVAKTG